MNSLNKDSKKIITSIVEIELDMFLQVRSISTSVCQEQPDAFKVMREMTHSILSPETLNSYLDDLRKAKGGNRNLVTEKYARMANQIPPLKNHPLIQKIVGSESRWLKEFNDTFPHIHNTRGPEFEIYLSSELETYSDKTIALYYQDIVNAQETGINLAEARYNKLAKTLGYPSINQMEQAMAGKTMRQYKGRGFPHKL